MGNAKSISITTDSWTSVSGNPYLSLTTHFVDQNFAIKSLPIKLKYLPESHSSYNIGAFINKSLNEFQIDKKTVSISSDSAANMIKLIDYLPDITHIPCLGHVINNLVKNNLIYDTSYQLNDLISRCRKLVGIFRA